MLASVPTGRYDLPIAERDGITVGVVGAGIGGLGAALSLLRAGFDVHVYEWVYGHDAARIGDLGVPLAGA